MNLDNIRIVLIATSHPGNIGSAARAMKTMGLKHLYLVNPKHFPDPRAYELAAGADDILDRATVTEDLNQALAGCHLILGTSARPRGLSLPGLVPSSAAELTAAQPDNQQVAILFGREHAGLTNEELLFCHYHINIPANPDYSSLNLAQAVQIIAYELRQKLIESAVQVELRSEPLAKAQDIDLFYQHLQEVLIQIEFLKLSHPRRLMQRIKRLFNRIKLEEMEVNLLRGMLTQIQRKIMIK